MSQPNRPKTPTKEAVEEDQAQYGSGPLSLAELEEKYPNRPHNHSKTLPFSELYLSLFNPLNENKKQPAATSGRPVPRSKLGPHGQAKVSPHEQRRHIIERFVSRWRNEVGPDFYPALRLILPDKDRDRGVYGLKENTIGKLLVKLMKIDRHSEDGYALLHWKLPGNTAAARMAGDFAGRCFEVLGKRAMRAEPGDMSVGEVNVWLDRLAAASGEAEQLPIMEEFYRRMSAEEMMWLIRIILKQMKVGATERTFLDLWHPDGEALFGVSSSLRRVCWELYDPNVRLGGEETGVTLMQCFQPQLAQFQMGNAGFKRMVEHLGVSEEDPEFWVEEKLDGERMQMHMVEDDGVPGGKRFCWWSRKAKDYTYLYGEGFEDDNSALTRHLKGAFAEGVRNCILDGEMITWDPDTDKIVAFGTLKTAALSEQKNPFDGKGPRPLYRVFDILYLNDQPLTRYTLWDRRRALERAVVGTPRRLEIHEYVSATSWEAVEPLLRKIVAEASEGLVLKNPRSMYRLNSRNDDWLKVKPEYMSEFGESLDCVVIGGYWGSGRRGGTLSSFLCGLRVGENYVKAGGAKPEKCLSFFKVGGGLKAEDYAEIRHRTEGKWVDWDAARPPSQYVELGGGERLQYERPDVWIRPRDSVVIEAKAAEIVPSDQFATGWTLRFPRFRRLRPDRAWDSALDVDGFDQLRNRVDREVKERKEMSVENRKRRPAKRARRELVIAGMDADGVSVAVGRKEKSKVFEGMEFCVLSESLKPVKKSKAALEALIKDNGGRISQRPDTGGGMVIVADKKVVKVASLMKEAGGVDVVRPRWVFDCLAQAKGPPAGYLLPFEEGHLFAATEATREAAARNADQFGDSYARDVDVDELAEILRGMPKSEDRDGFDAGAFLDQLEEHGHASVGATKGTMWRRCRVHFALGEGVSELRTLRLEHYVRFGGGEVVADADDEGTTQVVVVAADAKAQRALAADVRARVSSRRRVPRIVTGKWVEDCWREGTLVDEEAYAPS